MALVSKIVGNCPGCGRQRSFGNIDVHSTYVLQGCTSCRYKAHIPLPPLHKAVIYLDQFFFSHAFRGRDTQFVEAATKISRAASLQLLVAPYSSVHEDETNQWERSEELIDFIKATARGHEFEPAYNVERRQILQAFRAWLSSDKPEFVLRRADALPRELNSWESYFRIEVGGYNGDVELTRTLKHQSVESLLGVLKSWRERKTTFDQDLESEYLASAQGYVDSYFKYAMRMAEGDFSALYTSPLMSQVMEQMLRMIPEPTLPEKRFPMCGQFFMSQHFRQVPQELLSARIYATLIAMVKNGAYSNQAKARRQLSGLFGDVEHIATYAPYCDAIVVDKLMAELVAKPTVALEARYGVKVFSRNNWNALLAWLDSLEVGMSTEHKEGLAAAYWPRQLLPFGRAVRFSRENRSSSGNRGAPSFVRT